MIITSICILAILFLFSSCIYSRTQQCKTSKEYLKHNILNLKIMSILVILSLLCFLPIIEGISIAKHIYSYFDAPSLFAMVLICVMCLKHISSKTKTPAITKNNTSLKPIHLEANTDYIAQQPKDSIHNLAQINLYLNTSQPTQVTKNLDSIQSVSKSPTLFQVDNNLILKDTMLHPNKPKLIFLNNIQFNIYVAFILFIYGVILYGGSLGMIDFYLQAFNIQDFVSQLFELQTPLLHTFNAQAFDIFHASLPHQALIGFMLLILLYISNKGIGILGLFTLMLFNIFGGENVSLLECFICPYLWLYCIFYIIYRISFRLYRFCTHKI